MKKELLINVSEGEECRIALVENGRLEELYMERASSTSHVGNIYKGRVTNVEPSIQAAFVDFGLGRNGFLHISDLMPTYFGRKGEGVVETVGKKMARRDRPPIQQCLRRGDEIVVQIIKEGIGTKGPTLSTYLSIPGRFLVMMPGMGKMGVSKKIEDDAERRRLRQILDSLTPPEGCGFIIRTAGIGKTKAEIERDLKFLSRLWEQIKEKQKQPAPVELYTEGDLVTRTVRDVWSADIDRIVVDNKDVARRIRDFFRLAMPRSKNKVELHESPTPLFHQYKIESEIEQIYSRHVPLPSGGSLVIDSTEAIVAIDVNSGKFRDHKDAETTAFKTDMEAADEIPRQLRLRDLGGVIICDFIDLRFERHRRELEARLHENLKHDRAKTKVLRMSQFGIIEMTRQRMRPSLKRSIYHDCPACKGSGLVKTPESLSLDVMRRLTIAAHDARVSRIELTVHPDVAFYLLNSKRAQLAGLEADSGRRITVTGDPRCGGDEIRLTLLDSRDGLVYLPEIGVTPAGALEELRRRRPLPARGRQDPVEDRRREPPPRVELDDEFEDGREDDDEDAAERDEAQRSLPAPDETPSREPQAERDSLPRPQPSSGETLSQQQRQEQRQQRQDQRPQRHPPQPQRVPTPRALPARPPTTLPAPMGAGPYDDEDLIDEPQPNVAPDGTPLDENGQPRPVADRDPHRRGRRRRRRGRGGRGGQSQQHGQSHRPQHPQHPQQHPQHRYPHPQKPPTSHRGPSRPLEAGGEEFDVYDDEEPLPVPSQDRSPRAGPAADEVEESESIEIAPGGASSQALPADAGDPNQPRRRRRRRRGRRGRGRRGGGVEQGNLHPQDQRRDRPVDEDARTGDDRPTEPPQIEADEVKVADDRREVLDSKGGEPTDAEPTVVDPMSEPRSEPESAEEVVKPKRARKPRTTRAKSSKKTSKKTVKTAKVEPTGSSDKHQLERDVPVDPLLPERPMSRFDLDAIPDDFDD
jgi:ribonuclease E